MSEEILVEAFRTAMRRVPSPVTVVTAADGGQMRGMTVGSFTSVSLVPPLISFNVSHDARMHDLITRVRHFAVHLLSDEQANLSTTFAEPDRSGAQQFEDVSYSLDKHGVPLIDGAIAVFHCASYARHPAGDHSLLVGRVLSVSPATGDLPLVYFNREYRVLGEGLDIPVWPF